MKASEVLLPYQPCLKLLALTAPFLRSLSHSSIAPVFTYCLEDVLSTELEIRRNMLSKTNPQTLS